MEINKQLPKPLIFLICLIQGIVLTYLYKSIELELWPGNDLIWLHAIATFCISFPILTLFVITKDNLLAAVKYLLPFSLLLAALGAYTGLQLEPKDIVQDWNASFVFSLTVLIASFKALMYIQHYINKELVKKEHGNNDKIKITFSSLFRLSWRNFIVFCECYLFVIIFWGILFLGAQLFTVIGINFFEELLTKDWFVIPVLNLALGFAIVVFRSIGNTADTISSILQTLIKFLLPVLTFVSVGFICTLPFTGLYSLWQTGHGSFLVLWLVSLTLFFVNAVYKDEASQRPYHILLHRLIYTGVVALPIYSLIAGYGLWLRIEQYGLTVDRCWGVLIWFLLSCFSFSYLVSIIRRRDEWIVEAGKINVVMGKVVLTLMLLVNSPLLNFQSVAVQSQLARLESGEIKAKEIDYQYFANHLGRQGYLALQELKTSHPEQAAEIDRLYQRRLPSAERAKSLEDFKQYVTFWPSEDSFDKELIQHIYDRETDANWKNYRGNNYYFIAIDLNEDALPEMIVLTENNSHTSGAYWFKEEGKWTSRYADVINPEHNQFIKELVESNQISATQPQWKDLKIGDLVIKIQ